MVSMNTPRYSMSFTSGALLRHESIAVAELSHELGDWNAVRDTVVAENRLQMRTRNASQRICREVTFRLKQLTTIELEIVLDGSQQEQSQVLWLALRRTEADTRTADACRRHP